MPKFAAGSLAELATCHPDLQKVAERAIKYFDFKVMEGHRGEAEQEAAVAAGNSKVHYPDGKHNQTPSEAMDLAPYPVDWSGAQKAIERFVYMAGIVMCCAEQLLEEGEITHKIRWGGDWNQNEDMRDEKNFRDYPHFELVK